MVGDRKKALGTIAEKNRIINNIIEVIQNREHFLLVGHRNPNEDCVSSLVGFALIVVGTMLATRWR